jgi:hypothetical protein
MKRKAVVVLREIHKQKYLIELEDGEDIEQAKSRALEGEGEMLGDAEYAFTIDGEEAISDAYIVGEE